MNPLLLPGLPFLVALVFVLAAGQPLINALKARNGVQPISPDAPEKHRLKHGTPTMGGLLLLGGVTIAVLLMAQLFDSKMLLQQRWRLFGVLTTFLCGGVIGLLDDIGKARKKQNKAGLSERSKLGLQLFVATSFAVFLKMIQPDGATTILGFDLGWAYYGFAVLFIAGFGNAVNFTDGLDGLSSGTTLIVAGSLGLATMFSGGQTQLVIFYAAVAGACGGFLWFNSFPARCFMGDTGSQALGMGLAAAALVAKQEVLLLFVGVIYLAEIASMMIQRYVFKYRRKRFGLEFAQQNRVFRRAPLHHHFEELGWHETQVVGRFWVVSLIAAALGLLVFGGRL